MRQPAVAAGLAALAGLAGALAVEPLPATAAGFDCSKAAAADEKAICADSTLSALDSEMSGLWFAYRSLPLMMGASGIRRDEAKAFLTARAKCGADAACIGTLYRARIAALRAGITSGIAALGKPAAPEAPPPAPLPVMEQIGTLFGQCHDAGGELAGNAWPAMMSADLDHDGLPDFVLNAQNLRCEGAATAYCGNDGCDIWVDLSTADFTPIKLRGSQPTLVQGTERTTLDIWVDKSQCTDLPAGAACWGSWRWNGSALKPSYAPRGK